MTTTTKDTERKTTWRDVAIRGSNGQMSAHSRRLQAISDLMVAKERMVNAWAEQSRITDLYTDGRATLDQLNNALEIALGCEAEYHKAYELVYPHEHDYQPVASGGMSLSAGEVDDNIEVEYICTICGKPMPANDKEEWEGQLPF